ncbi:MAG: hypothetical protein V4850_29770 [Myxococcota bacterium]
MPRHEPVSPEEDLASYYGTQPPGAPGATVASTLPSAPAASTPPPLPSSVGAAPPAVPPPTPPQGPPPIPPSLAVSPSWPADGFEPDPNADPNAAQVGRLAPVSRPAPTFSSPVTVPADAPNPAVAALVSLFVPGAGQIYAGQTAKGVVMMLVAFGTCFGGGLLNVLAAVDALLIAQRQARGETVGDWQFF